MRLSCALCCAVSQRLSLERRRSCFLFVVTAVGASDHGACRARRTSEVLTSASRESSEATFKARGDVCADIWILWFASKHQSAQRGGRALRTTTLKGNEVVAESKEQEK